MTAIELNALKTSMITAKDMPISMNAISEHLLDLAIEWEEHPDHFEDINPFFIAIGKARNKLLEWKAQGPRLVTEDDFKNADELGWLPVWHEERYGGLYCECILIPALEEKDIRYWTAKPTDEQRKATPWEI